MTENYHLNNCQDCLHRHVCKFADKVNQLFEDGETPLYITEASCAEYICESKHEKTWQQFLQAINKNAVDYEDDDDEEDDYEDEVYEGEDDKEQIGFAIVVQEDEEKEARNIDATIKHILGKIKDPKCKSVDYVEFLSLIHSSIVQAERQGHKTLQVLLSKKTIDSMTSKNNVIGENPMLHLNGTAYAVRVDDRIPLGMYGLILKNN